MKAEIKQRIERFSNKEMQKDYKQTGVGMIPYTWKTVSLSSVMSNLEAGTSVNSDTSSNAAPYVLKTSAVVNGKVYLSEAKSVVSADIPRLKCPVKSGSILISRMNTPSLVGACGYSPYESLDHFLPDRLWQTCNKAPDLCDFVFLNYLLNSDRYISNIRALATGTSNSMKNISKEDFLNLIVALPSLSEQRKIAAILTTQDKVIELKEKLLVEKQRQKKHLMQQLLTGKKRLPGFDGKKVTYTFDEVFRVIPAKRYQILTTEYEQQGKYPVVDQSKTYVAGYSNTCAKLFKCPSNGIIVFGDHTREIKYIDFDFVVGADGTQLLTVTNDAFCTQFLYQYLKNQRINNDGYARHFKYIKAMLFDIPPFEEQSAIAAILSTADREISLLQESITAEKAKKKALMQLLLTGIVRVNVNQN